MPRVSAWRILRAALLPELRRRPDNEQDTLLRAARSERFSAIEAYGMLVWVLIVFLVTQTVLKGTPDGQELAFALIANLLGAAPAILCVAIPLNVRRTRRGLRRALAARQAALEASAVHHGR